jgi:hypothetical protein
VPSRESESMVRMIFFMECGNRRGVTCDARRGLVAVDLLFAAAWLRRASQVSPLHSYMFN